VLVRAGIRAAIARIIDPKNRASSAHDSKEKAQLAPGFPTIRDLELPHYITATPAVEVQSDVRNPYRPSTSSDYLRNLNVRYSLAVYGPQETTADLLG
jgi:hypothetical protein